MSHDPVCQRHVGAELSLDPLEFKFKAFRLSFYTCCLYKHGNSRKGHKHQLFTICDSPWTAISCSSFRKLWWRRIVTSLSSAWHTHIKIHIKTHANKWLNTLLKKEKNRQKAITWSCRSKAQVYVCLSHFTFSQDSANLLQRFVRVNCPEIYCFQSKRTISHLAHRDSLSELQQQWAPDFLLTHKRHCILYAASTKRQLLDCTVL